jgi:hypothetical protein
MRYFTRRIFSLPASTFSELVRPAAPLSVSVGGFLLPGSFLTDGAKYLPPFLSLLFPRKIDGELLPL